jgi:hypothetical protein
MAFLQLNRRYSTEMEREAGSGWRKCRFLNKQLIGLARVFNNSKRKFVLLQNLFSSLLSKIYYFCFIYIVLFELELTSYGKSVANWIFWTGEFFMRPLFCYGQNFSQLAKELCIQYLVRGPWQGS